MRRQLVVVTASLLVVASTGLPAQNTRNVNQAGAPAATAPRPDDRKKAMTVADYARWRTVTNVAISDDGNWASYGYQQRRVDDTLFVKSFAGLADQKIPRASRSQFSDDSKWIAYFVAEPIRAGDESANAGGGGGGGRGGDGAQAGPGRLELRNLGSGTVTSWDNVQSFAFSKGSKALMIRKARAGGGGGAAAAPAGGGGGRGGRGGGGGAAPAAVGTDMILRHLADGVDELIGSVSAAEFNRSGSLLAYTVGTAGRDGNGLFLVSIGSWQRRALDANRADYSRVTWDDSGSALAALRGLDRPRFAEKENALLAFTNLESPEPTSFVLERRALSGLADSLVLSEKGTLTWSSDRTKIFVGLKEQEAQTRRDTTVAAEPVGNVDVFHWKDPQLQTVQMARAQQDRNRTYTAAVILAQKKVVQLADARLDRVQVAKTGSWAIGQDDKDYISDWKPQQNDVYRLDVNTGARSAVLKGQERTMGLSPDGKYFLYWKDKHIWSYDIAADKHVNITKSAPVSFVNAEWDNFGDKPAYGVSGFSKDGKSVILDHRYDLWVVSLDGSGTPRNLTGGAGAKTETRFRYVRLEPEDGPAAAPAGGGGGGRGGAGSSTTIDLSKPITLTAFGDLTKKAGFYQLDGEKLTQLVYEDRTFGRPIKARNADRVLLTRETYVDFPDYWVTDSKFSNPSRLTTANPQQAEFKWGRRILIDYKDKDGHKLQGTLAIPDDYQPGEKRPMLVYYYEKLSQNQNAYEEPRYSSGPAYADYVSNGYLVLLPDVYLHTGRTHSDHLHSVEAAVKRVIDLGYADPKRVGLHGGSFSGQGGAYISTQSKMFAAIAIRAAAVDLVADFNQLWKTTGTNQHRYDTYGQGRFGATLYENPELYVDQSAITHVRDMNTPLLIFQGTNDGSTEWLQGVEFYNALRFHKKPVIFLSYEGEGHGFTRYDNQYDVQVRMKQFYDHHLKGAPAADWIANGIPFLKKKTPTGAAAQPVQLIGPGGGIGTPMTGGGGGGGGGATPPGGPPPL